MALLNKQKILSGVNEPEKVEIKALNGELWLRPLSGFELSEVEDIEAKAIGDFETNEKSQRQGKRLGKSETLSKGKINLSKANQASMNAKVTMVHMSLDNPKNADDPWSEEDIRMLRRDAFNEIVDHVRRLSGEDITKGEIESFPENE